ncbi:MAG: hypothetical protein KF814_13015 [Nitrospiraceae bacterium]|nr:hypothetical protein [Nitrospiraceae bacterium]
MKKTRIGWRHLFLLPTLCLVSPFAAHAFDTGSTGALGALAPVSNTVITLPPDGILNYTTVNIPGGVTVSFTRNAVNTSVILLAQGDVLINGTIHVNGSNGLAANPSSLNAGGLGGPGGSQGGNGGMKGLGNTIGSPGQGPGGGNATPHGTYGTLYGGLNDFRTLIPFFGGSGGNGGTGTTTNFGPSGGGGAGALIIASNTKITVSGIVRANGGDSGDCSAAGAGSGGALRFVAPEFNNTGTIESRGGCASQGFGRVRLEYQTSPSGIGTPYPSPYTSNTLGPLTATSTPTLTNVPTVSITAVGGTSAPGTPGGSFTTPDVSLSALTTNPVPVTVTATNTPVGSVFQIRVIPQFGPLLTVYTTMSTGTFASSTATANVMLPVGVTSLLDVYGSYLLVGP